MLLFDVKPADSTIYDNLKLVELMVAIITNWNYLIKNKLDLDTFISYDNSRYNQNHRRITTKLVHMK